MPTTTEQLKAQLEEIRRGRMDFDERERQLRDQLAKAEAEEAKQNRSRSHKQTTAIRLREVPLKLDAPVPLADISKLFICQTKTEKTASGILHGRDRSWLLDNWKHLPSTDWQCKITKGPHGAMCITLREALDLFHRLWVAKCGYGQAELPLPF